MSGRGRPRKCQLGKEDTCISLSLPHDYICNKCSIGPQSSNCEKYWLNKPISDEEIKKYIDVWTFLRMSGFSQPQYLRRLRNKSKCRALIDTTNKRQRILKDLGDETSSSNSQPLSTNPITTPTKKRTPSKSSSTTHEPDSTWSIEATDYKKFKLMESTSTLPTEDDDMESRCRQLHYKNDQPVFTTTDFAPVTCEIHPSIPPTHIEAQQYPPPAYFSYSYMHYPVYDIAKYYARPPSIDTTFASTEYALPPPRPADFSNSCMHYPVCGITKYDAPPNIGATEYARRRPSYLPESKHVLMAKIGLDTSDSGYVGVAHSLLAEVVDYLQSFNEVLWFKWMGNNKRGAVHIIPKSNGRNTFKQGEKKKGWLEAITEFIVSDSTDVDADDAAYWIMESLADKHEESFLKLANKHGFLAPKVMSETAMAAMVSDASLTVKQVRIIKKHTKAFFGQSILP